MTRAMALATILVVALLAVASVHAGPCAATNMRPIGGSGFNPFTGLPLAELSLWTYEGCNVFPNVANGTLMTVADQLELQTMSSANSDNEMLMLSNYTDYKKSKTSWDSWSINLIIAGFSHTAEAAKVKEILKSGHYQVVTYNLDLTAYTFYYHYAGAYAQKGSNLQLAVDRLPHTCSSSADRWYYRQFLHDFGPNVMSTGTAGTKVTFFSVFETDLLQTHNSSWVFHQTSLWIAIKMLDLGLSFSSNSTHISVSEEFLAKAWLTWQWQGGNMSDYTANRTEYLSTSFHHPVITGVVPVPIAEALPSDLPQRQCLDRLGKEWIHNNGTLPLTPSTPTTPVSPRAQARAALGQSRKPREAPLHAPAQDATCGSSTSCRPVMPGSFMFQRGYNVINQRSSVEPMFDFVWGDTEPMPSSPYHPEWTYSIPDELWMDHEQWSFNQSLYQTSMTAKSYYDTILHVSRSGGFFHTKSRTTMDIIAKHLSHNSSFATRSISQHLYRMGLDLTMPKKGNMPRISRFNPNFVEDVMALPTSYTSANASMYAAFMDRWGTDYVSQAMFGGFVEMITWFDSCFYSSYNAEFIEEQSGFDFIIARHEKGWETAQQKLNANWEEYRRVQTRLVGGNSGDFEPSMWDKWATTLYRFPVAYAVKPVSLELLINLISGERREAFTSARGAYLSTQFDALERLAKENAVPQPYTPPPWCSWH